MKILVIGGVAAGTKMAAKLKRENRDYDVTIITKGKDISYAGCGLPYYIGGVIEDKDSLIINTPESFSKLTEVDVINNTEAKFIDRENKIVIAKNLLTEEKVRFKYDKLVITTGADPIKPSVEGIDLEGVYYIRTPKDAIDLREVICKKEIKRVVVVGGGFIGLEVAENLYECNIKTTIIDVANHILPGFDNEVCSYIENELMENGIMVLTKEKLSSIEGKDKVNKIRTDKRSIKADLVVMAVGLKPNVELARDCGLELENNKTIKVNEYMQTSDNDIYAAGDCVSVNHILSNKKVWSPMGSSANKEGRCLAQILAGKGSKFRGVLGTAIVKLLNINAARTGFTEKEAINLGYDVESVIVPVDDKAHYYPDTDLIFIKLIADRNTEKVLGAQIFGKGIVDKQIDVVATAMTFDAKVSDLQNLDLAYAPPFSTAIPPIGHAANVLLNKINGEIDTITYDEFIKEQDLYKIIESGKIQQLEGVQFVNLTNINGKIDGLEYNDKILLVCARGKRAYMTYNRMKYYGYKDVKVLEGGIALNKDLLNLKLAGGN